jgi:hypothetical protein
VDGLRKCKMSDLCELLAMKIAAVTAEITARFALMATCFRGGDTEHREQLQNKVNILQRCGEYFAKKNCAAELAAKAAAAALAETEAASAAVEVSEAAAATTELVEGAAVAGEAAWLVKAEIAGRVRENGLGSERR